VVIYACSLFTAWAPPPPNSETTIAQLIKDFSDIERMIANLPKDKLADYQESPENWVLLALHDRVKVTNCWKAMFPQCIPDDIQCILREIPDYRWFIRVFARDIQTSLGRLVKCVLNLGEDAMTNPPVEFNEILRYMNTELEINKEFALLPEKRISPWKFIEKCPPRYFDPASQCHHWVNWPTKHQKLATWLKTSGKSKQTETEVDYVLRAYLKSTDYSGGMPGLQRYMVEIIHAKFIPGNKYRWTDPEGAPHTKSKSRLENRLSELKIEHTLKN
jgi:hypothetical protein